MIKSWLRGFAIAVLGLTVIVALLLAIAWNVLPLDRVAVNLRGETFSLADLEGGRAFLFFVFAVAVIVLAVIAAVLGVFVALVLALLGMAFGLLATVASLAAVLAPFALIAWLLWRLFRNPAPANAAARP